MLWKTSHRASHEVNAACRKALLRLSSHPAVPAGSPSSFQNITSLLSRSLTSSVEGTSTQEVHWKGYLHLSQGQEMWSSSGCCVMAASGVPSSKTCSHSLPYCFLGVLGWAHPWGLPGCSAVLLHPRPLLHEHVRQGGHRQGHL